jgi:thiol peroxidase
MSRSGAVTFKGNPLTLAGEAIQVGQQAPDFKLHFFKDGLKTLTLADVKGKPTLLSVVPSLDTPVCSEQTRKFDQALAQLKDQAACYTISLDMPFAQKRFCAAENISNMLTLSDVHNQSFGKAYGVLIEGLPIPLLARAIFVLDKSGRITYCEYVPEVTQHPNYEKAVEALKAASA